MKIFNREPQRDDKMWQGETAILIAVYRSN